MPFSLSVNERIRAFKFSNKDILPGTAVGLSTGAAIYVHQASRANQLNEEATKLAQQTAKYNEILSKFQTIAAVREAYRKETFTERECYDVCKRVGVNSPQTCLGPTKKWPKKSNLRGGGKSGMEGEKDFYCDELSDWLDAPAPPFDKMGNEIGRTRYHPLDLEMRESQQETPQYGIAEPVSRYGSVPLSNDIKPINPVPIVFVVFFVSVSYIMIKGLARKNPKSKFASLVHFFFPEKHLESDILEIKTQLNEIQNVQKEILLKLEKIN